MEITAIYNIFRAIFIVLDFFLLVIFVFALGKGLRFRPRYNLSPRSKEKVLTIRDAILRERYEAALKKFTANTPEAVKVAIIEMDNLADDILKRFGLEGEHMSDRLEQLAVADLKSLERLRRAHRLRNRLVHESGLGVERREIVNTAADYEAFFKEIGIIS